jgi:hypothetical protein
MSPELRVLILGSIRVKVGVLVWVVSLLPPLLFAFDDLVADHNQLFALVIEHIIH